MSSSPTPHQRREAVERFLDTSVAQQLADGARRRRLVVAAMQKSPYPAVRELAGQLRDGVTTVRQARNLQLYSEQLQTGLRRLRTLNPAAVIKSAIQRDGKGS